MNRRESFSSLEVTGIHVRLEQAELELGPTDGQEIEVLLAGDDAALESLQVGVRNGCLSVSRTLKDRVTDRFRNLGKSTWCQVSVLLPEGWKGGVRLSTGAGSLHVMDLDGSDIRLRVGKGDLLAEGVRAMTLKVSTRSGSLTVRDVVADKCKLCTACAKADLDHGTAARWSVRTLTGDGKIRFDSEPARVRALSLSGNLLFAVPAAGVNAWIRSLKGRVRTDGIFLKDEGVKISMKSLTGHLRLQRGTEDDRPAPEHPPVQRPGQYPGIPEQYPEIQDIPIQETFPGENPEKTDAPFVDHDRADINDKEDMTNGQTEFWRIRRRRQYAAADAAGTEDAAADGSGTGEA